jgi:hypothetical protein
MVKQYLILLGFLLSAFTPLQTVKAESISKVEDWYVTTEDIISDIVFPSIDKRVAKEYGRDSLFGWQWKRIVGIDYNKNHSYDVSIRIEVPSDSNKPFDYVEDLVKVRISPSCDSEKLNKQLCNHDFNIEVLDYKHLSQ